MVPGNPEIVAPSRARMSMVHFGATLDAMETMEAIWANSAQKGPRSAGLKVNSNIHIPRTRFLVGLKLLNVMFRKKISAISKI